MPKNTALTFDETNRNWSPQFEYNKLFVQATRNYLTDLLLSRGHVFLNEAYDELGFPRTREGVLKGWVLGEGSQGKVNIKVREGRGDLDLEFITDGNIHDRI